MTKFGILYSIISGKNVCSLCSCDLDSNNEYFSINDTVFLPNTPDASLNFCQIMNIILNKDIQYISNFICSKCAKNALEAYKFIQTCQRMERTQNNLASTISSFYNSIKQLDEKKNHKAIYVKADMKNDGFQFHIDRKRCKQKKIILSIQKKSRVENVNQENSCEDLENTIAKKYSCHLCIKVFPCKKYLNAHQERVHAPKIFKCIKCLRSYGSANLLKSHETASHTNLICKECGKTYNNVISLKQHERAHRTKLSCQNCSRVYKHVRRYQYHIKNCGMKLKSQLSDKYICDICNKAYTQKGTLRAHIKTEHVTDGGHTCSWCCKKFSAVSKLNAHIVTHTQEKKFQCSICGGHFVTKESLVNHTRIHTGEKPFSCSQCEEKFLSASRRMDHIRSKHKKKFDCNQCDLTFTNWTSLKRHHELHLFAPQLVNALIKKT